ncbi:MAG: hypothetical protein IJK40_03315, partial [Clostridia bacterium]|nr:hypothetical protein [Clostridia bacterium]
TVFERMEKMKTLKLKKRFITIGLIASVILILAGIVVLTGFFGKWGYSPSGWPEKIGSNFGYGVFGSDFYSYVVNNAAQAGFSANNAANNIYDVVMMLRFSIGLFMICFGLGSLGAFGMAFTGYMKNGKDALEVPTAPTTPEVNSFIAPNPGNIGTQAAPADNTASLT